MECELMEQGHCYYDGSSLAAEKVMQILAEEGDEAVWKRMEEYWDATFTVADLSDREAQQEVS
jgi:hypothetical protein